MPSVNMMTTMTDLLSTLLTPIESMKADLSSTPNRVQALDSIRGEVRASESVVDEKLIYMLSTFSAVQSNSAARHR